MRHIWTDYCRGIAIFLIVVCHTINGLISAKLIPSELGWTFFNNVCYAFQVPVFFFISGLFAKKSLIDHGLKVFLVKKGSSLVYPYLVWQTIQILIMIATGSSNNKPNWTNIAFAPLGGYMQFWFIYTLILIFALYVILSAWGFSDKRILLIGLGLCVLWPLTPRKFCSLIYLQQSFVYFCLGLCSTNSIQKLTCSRKSSKILLCSFLFLTIVVLLVDMNMVGESIWRPLTAVFGILFVICISLFLSAGHHFNFLTLLGRYSLQIYCAHVIIAAGVRLVLLKGLHLHSEMAHILLGVLLALSLPVLIAKVDERGRLHMFKLI